MIDWLPTLVAFAASVLTFFSGFGLGTLLLPAFAVFFPIEMAVAMTAVVHFANNLFKLGLMRQHARWDLVLRFGLPAMLAAFVGAWLLTVLTDLKPLLTWQSPLGPAAVTWVGLAIGCLLIFFAWQELKPGALGRLIPLRALPIGGALSGFFGGLSGHQGALRSVFLLHTGVDKAAFIGTGVACAVLIDAARIATYSSRAVFSVDWQSLIGPMAAAMIGALLGKRLLEKVTLQAIQKLVAVLLVALGLAMAVGVL